MSVLLTSSEYHALADSLSLPGGAFIDGKSLNPGGARFDCVNPATGEVLATLPICDEVVVDEAVAKARQAFEAGSWSCMDPSERKKVLIKLVKLMRREFHELAVMESLDSGKPVAEIETVDLPETLHCLEWYAELADKRYDEIAPSGEDAVALVLREPVGVVGCVLPWNFPLLMLAWKLGPALISGNSVVLKPAEETSLTALRVAELAQQAGLPRGVLNVVTGTGEVTGQALGLHPDVDMISFTGSTDTGRRFLRYAADSNLKNVVLECGGKNPCVVLDDAENLDVVADHAVSGMLWNMGQNCSANSRLIVHKAVSQALVERLRECMAQWRTGEPLDPVNRLGAIVSRAYFEKILQHIERAKSEGARLLVGGKALGQSEGLYIEPTLFDQVSAKMAIAREEIFGPVLGILTVATVEDAIALANDTCYGLAASLFTSNLRRAHRIGRELKAGTVTVNCFGEGNVATPFGGYGQSGFGGRDKGKYALDQYTQLKTLWIDLGDRELESGIG
jgi:gamma-glutamyl-gamma-aminobutyraldehyde dehydrogenase